MESTLLYLVAFCIFCGLSFVLWTTKFIFPNVKNFFSRWLKYPLLIQRGRYWDSVTYLQASILAVFFILNLLIIFWPLVEAVDWRVVEKRCAFAAAVNIVPLCIGGRMGLLVRTFNIHRSTYQLFHHWTGRIAVFEGLAHAILVLCHRPKPGQLVLSGWIVSIYESSMRTRLTSPQILGTSLGCLLLSLCLVRVWLGRWFLLSHRVFALATVGGLIWHVLKLSRKAPRVVACLAACLWIFTTCQRLYMIFSYRQSAEVVQKVNGLGATKLELSVKRPVRVPAGSYFNVFFPSQHGSYNILHSYPVMAMWHPPDEHSPSQRLSHISLLMTQRGSYAAALANLQQGQRILLDGPYGQNLRPKLYENVILAVKGMGIAGVLPLALEFAERRQHDNGTKSKLQALWRRLEELSAQIEASRGDKRDAIVQQREKISKEREALARKPLFRDATKRIDLFWSLESDSEPDLVAEELRDLQKLDPGNVGYILSSWVVSDSFNRTCSLFGWATQDRWLDTRPSN